MKIKIKKANLLGILNTNKSDHVKIYNESLAQFKKELREFYATQISNLQNEQPFAVAFKKQMPVSYEGEYDNAIRALELSEDSEIELHEDDVRTYIMDQWNWGHNFYSNFKLYAQPAAFTSTVIKKGLKPEDY